jgi:ABC-2 type transport system ATP-binding protein
MSDARVPVIAATGLRKSFGEAVVLDGVDLSVAEGTIFALLGPNGAGKTTMVRIMSTLIRADSAARVAHQPGIAYPENTRDRFWRLWSPYHGGFVLSGRGRGGWLPA